MYNRLTSPRDVARALRPLAGVLGNCFFGVVWILRGDLEHFNLELNLPNPNSNAPCALCPANTTDRPMHEYRTGRMRWMADIYSRARFFATRWCTHAIFHDVHGGIYSATVFPDWLHTKHLGTDAYFYGSVLWMLVYMLLPGTPQENMNTVLAEIKTHYTRLAIPYRYQNIKLSMFCDRQDPPGTHPKLKGRGAEIRYVGFALQVIWERYMDRSNTQQVQVLVALNASVAAEQILIDHKHCFCFSSDVGRQFKNHVFAFLVAFNALGSFYSRVLNVKLFDLTVKAHYLAHLGLIGEYCNPRLGWAYSGEDLMHHCQRLMSMCCKGTKPLITAEKFAERYAMGMHLKFVGDTNRPLLK